MSPGDILSLNDLLHITLEPMLHNLMKIVFQSPFMSCPSQLLGSPLDHPSDLEDVDKTVHHNLINNLPEDESITG